MGYFNNNGIVDMLASMFGESLLLNPAASTLRCSTCGTTFEDIASLGKAGCPNCYKTFEKEFKSSLNSIHGNVNHIGKRPKTVSFSQTVDESKKEQESVEQKIARLKNKLNNAVKEENFEEAARLRDLINDLKGERNDE